MPTSAGVPEAALAMGDMAARTPASRDKAANEKAVRAAITWYEAAAQSGVPSAQFKLANAYFAGRRRRPRSAAGAAMVRARRRSGTTRSPACARHLPDRAAWPARPTPSKATSGCCWPTAQACPTAKRAREGGGKDRRRRSQARRGAGGEFRRPARTAARRRAAAAGPADQAPSLAETPRGVPSSPAPGATRHHGRRLPRRLPADAPGGPVSVARDAAAERPARRHLRGRTRRRAHDRRGEVVDRGLAGRREMARLSRWCDQLYFAVPVDFPQPLIPDEIGLIVADAYGGEILRHPPKPAGGGGAPQVAADRLRAARVRAAGAARGSRLHRFCLSRLDAVA